MAELESLALARGREPSKQQRPGLLPGAAFFLSDRPAVRPSDRPLRYYRRRARLVEPSRVALSGRHDHTRKDRISGPILRQCSEPAVAPGVDPPHTLLPEQRHEPVIEDLRDDCRVRTRRRQRGGSEPT